MEPRYHHPVDLIEIEAKARRLRAETFANGMATVGRWVAAPFQRRTHA